MVSRFDDVNWLYYKTEKRTFHIRIVYNYKGTNGQQAIVFSSAFIDFKRKLIKNTLWLSGFVMRFQRNVDILKVWEMAGAETSSS